MRRAPMGADVEDVASEISINHLSKTATPIMIDIQKMCAKQTYCVATSELAGKIISKLVCPYNTLPVASAVDDTCCYWCRNCDPDTVACTLLTELCGDYIERSSTLRCHDWCRHDSCDALKGSSPEQMKPLVDHPLRCVQGRLSKEDKKLTKALQRAARAIERFYARTTDESGVSKEVYRQAMKQVNNTNSDVRNFGVETIRVAKTQCISARGICKKRLDEMDHEVCFTLPDMIQRYAVHPQ